MQMVTMAHSFWVLSIKAPLWETSLEPPAPGQKGADLNLSSDQPESPMIPPQLQILGSLQGGQDFDIGDAQPCLTAFVKDGLTPLLVH